LHVPSLLPERVGGPLRRRAFASTRRPTTRPADARPLLQTRRRQPDPRAEDASGASIVGGHTSRLGLAESNDGLHFTRHPAPVLFQTNDAQQFNEWPGGMEVPRLVEAEDGRYILTYTQWNRDVPRLAVATSRDLVDWEKHGPAFAAAAGGKYLTTESKSGAILSRLVGERIVATKVNGKDWMYYNVPHVLIATSDDLVHWTPMEDANGRALAVLSPRPGYFDSWLVVAGPPPLLTDRENLVLCASPPLHLLFPW
jgi:predicted GH43/DUF377 family glycosyl hydrolase